MRKILSIAGSDCSGGAGIQADIKTITAHNMYAMSVVTALTAQNTLGVHAIIEVAPEFVEKQLDAVLSDIYPDAVKIGMVSNRSIIEVIIKKLKEYKVQNIVLDPVMISTSGKELLKNDAVELLINALIPLANVITPNIPEAMRLSGFPIASKNDMMAAAAEISKSYSGSILIKGGHSEGNSDDLLYEKGNYYWYDQQQIDNPNTHGTGCTLSSAIACQLAAGRSIKDSVSVAKSYITGAIQAGLDLGSGSGPLNHCWNL